MRKNITYGATVRWTRRNGQVSEYRLTDFSNVGDLEVELKHIRRRIEREGWTPPRWWQWWRRHDTNPFSNYTCVRDASSE